MPDQHPTRQHPGLLQDRQLRQVPWRDLAGLSSWGRCREVLLPVPWLLLALATASPRLFPLALLAGFYFFLTGLRLIHDVFHANLGLPRWANHLLLSGLSLLMLGSMHAVRLTHLEHHRDCLGPEDTEGGVARQSFWGALRSAPMFPVQLLAAAWARGTQGDRRWIVFDLSLNLLWLGPLLVSGLWPFGFFAGMMLVGQLLSGFFAVWTVHHDCDRWEEVARTLRHRFKSLLVYDMFYHQEHHLFPRVPTRHLPALAARLDAQAPQLPRKRVY